MSKLERITVTMPEEMAMKLRSAVDSGSYASTSEIVREALRGWSDDQAQRHAGHEVLAREIEKGLEGPFLDGPTVLNSLIDKYEAIAAEK